jgi:hypothetical protein
MNGTKFSGSRLILVGLLLVLNGSIHAAFAQVLGERHFEKEGGFSYRPPEGWQVGPFPGLEFMAVTGPASDGFAANINFADEDFQGSVEEYADADMKMVQFVFKDLKVLGRETFKTDQGKTAVKITTQSEQSGKMLRQIFFFFEGPAGKKLAAICSSSAKDGEILDGLFDASMKTLDFEKQP